MLGSSDTRRQSSPSSHDRVNRRLRKVGSWRQQGFGESRWHTHALDDTGRLILAGIGVGANVAAISLGDNIGSCLPLGNDNVRWRL